MSVFQPIPKCEICHEREPRPERKRCDHCKDRYDDSGTAYIIYCEFYRYVAHNKDRCSKKRIMHSFWVCDGRVQRAPISYGYLVGRSVDYLQTEMTNWGWTLLEIEPAVWK